MKANLLPWGGRLCLVNKSGVRDMEPNWQRRKTQKQNLENKLFPCSGAKHPPRSQIPFIPKKKKTCRVNPFERPGFSRYLCLPRRKHSFTHDFFFFKINIQGSHLIGVGWPQIIQCTNWVEMDISSAVYTRMVTKHYPIPLLRDPSDRC